MMPSPQTQKRKKQSHSHIDPDELKRLKRLTKFERDASKKGFNVIAGVDEAGRGPLAGPVVAAACIIPKGRYIVGVNDSKKLIPQQRHDLFEEITADKTITYSVGVISSEEIDRINILQATIAAMLQAIAQLPCIPDMLLVDGMHLDYSAQCQKIIDGDQKSQSIAAASIIAKETRDRMMRKYHLMWPQYGFDQHKGYGTEAHYKALAEHGPCPIHRITFRGVRKEEREETCNQEVGVFKN